MSYLSLGRALACSLVVLPVIVACSDSSGSPADAGLTDGAPADGGADAGPTEFSGGVFDTSTTWGAEPLTCPDGVQTREGRALGDQRRFALTVLHYNIQYVAGGLDNAELAGEELYDGWDDDRVQDLIVTDSLVPVLDMLERHPSWTLTLEMQGYTVEVLLARHRPVAQQLADLVAAGQVELVSFHYSDALFLAYPRRHMEVSREINARALADGCMAPSAPVFTQEGQYGLGITALEPEAIGLLPKNLLKHFQGEGPRALFYEVDGVPVVVAGEGVAGSGFTATWAYMDDAELLPTGTNPYFPDLFVHDPERMDEFEAELAALEAGGFVIAGVGDYVATLQEAGVAPEPLPAILDGTWQPRDTGNVARWMGSGGLFGDFERDNAVLTRNSEAGRLVLAAEVAVAAARDTGALPTDVDARLERAWRDLLLGEVSDATGWNPIPTEVEYAFWHADAASTRATELVQMAAGALGLSGSVVVDTAGGTVSDAGGYVAPVTEPAEAPVEVMLETQARPSVTTWTRYADDPDHFVLTVDVSEGEGVVTVSFPRGLDTVRYTPGLMDGTLVDAPLSGFTFEQTAIPLGSGPFALRDDLFIVPDTTAVHVALRFEREGTTVYFRDSTLPDHWSTRWVFHLVRGTAEEALEVADRLNLRPIVLVPGP